MTIISFLVFVVATNSTTPPPPSCKCKSEMNDDIDGSIFLAFCDFGEYICASNDSFSCLSFSSTFCNGVADCNTLVNGAPLDEVFCSGQSLNKTVKPVLMATCI